MHLPMTLLGLAALSVALSPMALASPAGSTSPSTRSSSHTSGRTNAPNPCLVITEKSNLSQVNPCIAEMISVELDSRGSSSPPKIEAYQRALENVIENMLDAGDLVREGEVYFKSKLILKAGLSIGRYVDWLERTKWEEDDRRGRDKTARMTVRNEPDGPISEDPLDALRERSAREKRENELARKTPEELIKELEGHIVIISTFTNMILRLPPYYEIKDKPYRYEYMVMVIGVLSLELSSRTRNLPDQDRRIQGILQDVQAALDRMIKVDKTGQVDLKTYIPVNTQPIKEAREALTYRNMNSGPGSTYNGSFIPIDVPAFLEERHRLFEESKELKPSWGEETNVRLSVYEQQFRQAGKVDSAKDAQVALDAWRKRRSLRQSYMDGIEKLRRADGSGNATTLQQGLYGFMWTFPAQYGFENAFFLEAEAELAR